MNARRWGLAAIFAINLVGVRYLFSETDLWGDKENHDTRVLYGIIQYENTPLRWLTGDWPLYNGFYRPLPSLAFEADRALYGPVLEMYIGFNWVIGILSAFLLAWFVYEATRSDGWAIGSAIVFSVWQVGLADWIPFESIGRYLALLAAVFALASLPGSRERARSWLLSAALLFYLGIELAFNLGAIDGLNMSLSYRAIGWPPGRTTTMLTLFALLSMGAYCRFERDGRARWYVVSLLGLLGALGCHEGAIVVPGMLIATAIYLRVQGVKVRWWAHALPWTILGTYILLHLNLLSVDSRYIQQHDRGWRGAKFAIIDWLFPARRDVLIAGNLFDPQIGVYCFLIANFWQSVARLVSTIAALVSSMRLWRHAAFGLFGSLAALLPLAFEIPLGHYYHLPAAIRSIYVVALCAILAQHLRTAWSHGERISAPIESRTPT